MIVSLVFVAGWEPIYRACPVGGQAASIAEPSVDRASVGSILNLYRISTYGKPERGWSVVSIRGIASNKLMWEAETETP
jgi:hypothetical protein